MQQAHTLVEENSYKAALDSITLCLESEKGKSKISKWYCDDAINQYRNISRRQPQQRVIEIINLRAFGAMKNEVNHYLRIKSVDRLLFSPPTRNEEYLQLVLERTSIGFWVLISITFVSIIISFFTLFPPQNKTVN